MDSVDRSALLASLRTGDLVLLSGNSLARGLARWLRRARLAGGRPEHVGMVVEGADGARQLWEAPPLARASEREKAPTELTPLAERLGEVRGRITVRRLSPALTSTQQRRLETLRAELAAAASAHSLIDLMAAAEDGWVGAEREHLGAPLPGELVARAYQRLGLLDDTLPASHYRPAHFSERQGLALRRGFALGPEVPLTPADGAGGWPDLAQPQPA